ncbi:hypothetical protein OG547_35310 (plasmid) [Streptomyces longwoodensis]|uniref:hypothetical protein n=1 Tax=Streptomyces longwoodensis TaxID=68231 RepID=UPI002ED1DB71|nr:hypothetical protein OG547_35310 [Streptomyces longwoodensis]
MGAGVEPTDVADVEHGPAVAGGLGEPAVGEVHGPCVELPAVGVEDQQPVFTGGTVPEQQHADPLGDLRRGLA